LGEAGFDDEGIRNMIQSLKDKEAVKNITSIGQAMTDISGAAASIGSSIISAVNTWKVFNDETATAEQKATSLVSTLGTIPMTFANGAKLVGTFGNAIGKTGLTVGGLTGIVAAGAALATVADIVISS